MRKYLVGLWAAAFAAVPAFAETKTVQAFCEIPKQKIVTNVVSVTINVDTSSGDQRAIAKSMAEKIGYKASETFYKMGINPDDGVNCRFSDPALYETNENKPLDYLRTIPDEWVRRLGFRIVTVSGFGEEEATASSKVDARPQAERPRRMESTAPAVPVVKGPTPSELKYQRELEAYNARLAEIERIKADTASGHAANTLAAQQRLAQHEGDMARHRQQVAQAEAVRRRYEADLAAHQQRVRDTETKRDREAKIDWKEGVVVCVLNPDNPQTKLGNWRCEGPLQMTYAKLGNPGQVVSAGALVPLSQACGGAREAVRDLGMVGDARVFGCSYGIHPQSKGSAFDAAATHGLGYIPGRITYRCPAYKSGCRTQ